MSSSTSWQCLSGSDVAKPLVAKAVAVSEIQVGEELCCRQAVASNALALYQSQSLQGREAWQDIDQAFPSEFPTAREE
eukprot:scaffold439348_cov52-Prasinocladus_malaysianus.AAC.1